MLLAGDETAVPAIAGILEGLLHSGWKGTGLALLEVPEHADTNLTLAKPEGFSIDWVSRSSGRDVPHVDHGASLISRVGNYAASHSNMLSRSRADHGKLLQQDFADIDVDQELLWEVPEEAQHDGFYAWMAGEAATMRTLRRILVRDYGVNRTRVAFMGYWRAGKSEM